ALAFCKMQSSPPREVLDARSLSTLVQMVGAGIGVTLIPEMAVPVETRSAPVSVARFKNPQPSRTIGMVWRKTSPLAAQLQQISEVVCIAADALRDQRRAKPPPRQLRSASTASPPVRFLALQELCYWVRTQEKPQSLNSCRRQYV